MFFIEILFIGLKSLSSLKLSLMLDLCNPHLLSFLLWHLMWVNYSARVMQSLGLITSRCLGKEPALLPRRHGWTREDSFVSLSQSDNRPQIFVGNKSKHKLSRQIVVNKMAEDVGSITNRCSGKEPALLPRRGTDQTRESGGNRAYGECGIDSFGTRENCRDVSDWKSKKFWAGSVRNVSRRPGRGPNSISRIGKVFNYLSAPIFFDIVRPKCAKSSSRCTYVTPSSLSKISRVEYSRVQPAKLTNHSAHTNY